LVISAAVVVLAGLLPIAAGAQPSPAKPPAGTPAKPPAGDAAGPAAGDPDKPAAEDPREIAVSGFKEGKQAFGESRFEDALAAFRRSYEAMKSPNTKLMVVRTLKALDKPVEAYQESIGDQDVMDAAAADNPEKYSDAVQAIRNEAESLKAAIGFLTVRVTGAPAGATLRVAGEEIERSRWGEQLVVKPGTIEVELQTAEGSNKQQVVVTPGAQVPVNMVPPAKPEPEPEPSTGLFDGSSNQRLLAYGAAGVGVAGFILFGVLGGLHLSTYSDLESACEGGVCPLSREGDIDQGRGYQTGANVCLVIGIVGLGAGAALFFTTDWLEWLNGDEGGDDSSDDDVELGVTPGGLQLRGRF